MENTERSYSVTIGEHSDNLTHRQMIRYKDSTVHAKIDDALNGENGNSTLVIRPVGYCVLHIHNEKSEDKDYENYVIIDEAGTSWVTGSESFWRSFMDLWDELIDDPEPWDIEISRSPSKNYKGKFFITCSLVG